MFQNLMKMLKRNGLKYKINIKRADLIPNLFENCKSLCKSWKSTFVEVTEARSKSFSNKFRCK